MPESDDHDPKILEKGVERIDHMVSRHNKVLITRFDAHFPQMGYVPDGSNREISRLMKSLAETYEDQGHEVHYVWAREKKPERPFHHYHVAMLTNGSLMQNPHKLHKRAGAAWSHQLGGSFENLIHHCHQDKQGKSSPGAVMLRRPSSKATGQERISQEREFNERRDEAIHVMSYLAKNATKEDKLPHRVRRYGSSELKNKVGQNNG